MSDHEQVEKVDVLLELVGRLDDLDDVIFKLIHTPDGRLFDVVIVRLRFLNRLHCDGNLTLPFGQLDNDRKINEPENEFKREKQNQEIEKEMIKKEIIRNA